MTFFENLGVVDNLRGSFIDFQSHTCFVKFYGMLYEKQVK